MLVHISKFDMYKSGKALYHVDRIIRENGTMVDNGFRKRLFKTTEEGVNEMCEVIEKYIAEGRREGIRKGRSEGRREGMRKGRREGKAEAIRNLMESMSMTAEQAMKALKIPAGEFGKYMTLL
ncbi:MAG: hypothetical protein PUF06_01365 [Veillonellaceae bacterium]|nr:hypothetical protein [Veillonellaceae bacterium]MDD7656206.1 hypothetical protein [Veillonellaceae bacterium]